MGMHKIKEITSVLQKNNKGDTPIAIIQNGTTQNERIGVGTVNNILEIVSSKKLSSPAIIIIGEVVKESIKLRSFYENIYLNNISAA
jgi:uroporphyrin-III C-methyltransferase